MILDSPTDFKEAVCTVHADLYGVKKKFNVHDDLAINYGQLELEMDNFPQVYHMWAMVYSEVKEQQDTVDTQIKKRKFAVTKLILDEMGGKIRKSDIDSMIDCDDVLTKLEAKKIMLEKKTRKLYYTLEALRMKNDNMRSLSGFKKHEMLNS